MGRDGLLHKANLLRADGNRCQNQEDGVDLRFAMMSPVAAY
jgi:hypothetical protein